MLEALHLDTDEDTGVAAGAADLAGYLQGGTVAVVQSILAELAARALIYPWPEDADPSVLPRYLPVSSLKDVIGAHPAGLGRSYSGFARSNPAWGAALVAVAADLRSHGADIAPAGTAAEAAAALAGWVGQFANLDHLLLGAPDATAALLARFATGPIGSVPAGIRGPALLQANLDDDGGTALGWLVARGLLVPIDGEHVELPAEVSRLVRGGYLVAGFAPEPPAVPTPHIRLTVRENASLGSIAELLRTMTALLAEVAAAPWPRCAPAGWACARCRLAGRCAWTPPRPPSTWSWPPWRPGGARRRHLGVGAAARRLAVAAAPAAVAVAGQRLAGERPGPVAGGHAAPASTPPAGPPSMPCPRRPSAPTPRSSADGSSTSWTN